MKREITKEITHEIEKKYYGKYSIIDALLIFIFKKTYLYSQKDIFIDLFIKYINDNDTITYKFYDATPSELLYSLTELFNINFIVITDKFSFLMTENSEFKNKATIKLKLENSNYYYINDDFDYL